MLRYARTSLWCLPVILVFMSVLPVESSAQTLDPFWGLHGGLGDNSPVMKVSSDHYFPPDYSTTHSLGTYGITAGILVRDKFEIRVEGVRSRFHFESRSTAPYPLSNSKWTSVVDDHVTQYPFLVSYRVSSGSVRTFVGGGLTLRRTIKATDTTVTTTITPGPNPVETTTVETTSFNRDDLGSPIAVNASFGVEVRKGWISLRPEVRVGFWSGYRISTSSGEDQTLYSPVQGEFMVGLRVHPFNVR